ncbi:MAG: hypothetical protein HY608_08685 [Planctomycetes bacterium]|nr:hypothetical protein [Planctomycetota bacterium]
MPRFQIGQTVVVARPPFLHQGIFVKRGARVVVKGIIEETDAARYRVEYLDFEMQPHLVEMAERDLEPCATQEPIPKPLVVPRTVRFPRTEGPVSGARPPNTGPSSLGRDSLAPRDDI